MGLSTLRRLLPLPVRHALREGVWLGGVRVALRALEALPPARLPSRSLLERLRRAWGNEGWAAEVEFLQEVVQQVANTPGPILECGSGVTTLLLAVLAARRGVEVWVLEHDPHWHARVARALGPRRTRTIRLWLSRVRPHGEFDWYDAPLAEMPSAFRLVVCDGPPEMTRGGRYGVVPTLAGRLPSDAILLLDNAARPRQLDALQRWEREAGMRFRLHPHATCTYAVVIATPRSQPA